MRRATSAPLAGIYSRSRRSQGVLPVTHPLADARESAWWARRMSTMMLATAGLFTALSVAACGGGGGH